MTAPSRWMLRLSFIYLITGAAIGTVMLINKAFPFQPAVWILRPVHIQLLIWGWIIQFTLGTAHHILPRYVNGDPRGNKTLSKLMIISLNAGILLNIAAEFSTKDSSLSTYGLVLQAVAVGLFVFLHWQRATSYNT